MADRIALNIARILHRLMVDPRGWSRHGIRDELDIAERTYRKYRALLRELEPLIDPSGQLRIEEVQDGEVRYLRLRSEGPPSEERPGFLGGVVGLWLARQLLSFAGDSDLRRAIEDSWSDFARSVGDKAFYLGHLLLNTDRMVHVIPDAPKDYSGREEDLRTLVECLFFGRKVGFDYTPATGVERRHVVCPLTLVLWRSGLYLVGAYRPDGKPYVFAVDRMRGVRKGDGRFRYPRAADYDPAELFEGSFGIWQEPGAQRSEVRLRFAANDWLHRYLKERTWHPSQRWADLDDGRLEMTFEVTSMVEVWPWIRSFGDDVEVVQPGPEDA